MAISVLIVVLGPASHALWSESSFKELLGRIPALNCGAGVLRSFPVSSGKGEVAGDAYCAYRLSGCYQGSLADLRRQVKKLCESIEVEGTTVSVVPAELASGEKKLVVTDVDSTLVAQEVIDEIADHAGRGEQVADITERAMAGELNFEQSLRDRVALLKGVPEGVLGEVADSILLNPGAGELVRRLTEGGHRVGAVSGGFIQVLEPIAQRLGLTYAHANRLGIESGVLTGEVVGSIVTPRVKRSLLTQWADAEGVSAGQILAIGDGANDILMVEQATLGVAFRAKTRLREVADAQINIGRLDAVRHFIGL